MFLKVLLSLIIMSSSAAFSAELTAAEIALQAKIDAMIVAAQKNAKASEAENSAFSDAVSAYADSFKEKGSSLKSDIANKTSNILTRARAGMAKWFAPDEDSESAIEASSIKIQKENMRAMQVAQDKADAAGRKASAAGSNAISSANAAFKATNEAISSTTSTVASAAYIKMKEKALDTWITAAGLQGEMATINNSFKDLNEAKILLERKLDRSIMGNYMQNKMTKLLNSDVFCKAASSPSCQKGKSTSAFKASDLKSVFPSNPESNYAGSSAGAGSSSGAAATKSKK